MSFAITRSAWRRYIFAGKAWMPWEESIGNNASSAKCHVYALCCGFAPYKLTNKYIWISNETGPKSCLSACPGRKKNKKETLLFPIYLQIISWAFDAAWATIQTCCLSPAKNWKTFYFICRTATVAKCFRIFANCQLPNANWQGNTRLHKQHNKLAMNLISTDNNIHGQLLIFHNFYSVWCLGNLAANPLNSSTYKKFPLLKFFYLLFRVWMSEMSNMNIIQPLLVCTKRHYFE